MNSPVPPFLLSQKRMIMVKEMSEWRRGEGEGGIEGEEGDGGDGGREQRFLAKEEGALT